VCEGGGEVNTLKGLLLLLDGSEESCLLLGSLESTVADLGRGIDELEVDLLESGSGDLREEGLPEGDDSLLGASDATLEHHPVLVDHTVVGETTHGGDGLLGEIVLGGGSVGLDSQSLTDSVDLLVDLSSLVVTVLTSAGNLELDTSRMPSSNAGNLSLTSVGLPGQDGDTPSLDDAGVSVTASDSDNVNHLILVKDGGEGDLLLKELAAEVDLVRDGTTVDLNLNNVGLLHANLALGHLSVHNCANDVAILLGSGNLSGHLVVLVVLLSVLSEGLLLGLIPLLVETSSNLIRQVLSPDGGQSSHTEGGLNVSNETDANHRGSLKNGDGLNNLLLVELGSGLVDITNNVGHTALVSHESGEMARLGLVILGKGL